MSKKPKLQFMLSKDASNNQLQRSAGSKFLRVLSIPLPAPAELER